MKIVTSDDNDDGDKETNCGRLIGTWKGVTGRINSERKSGIEIAVDGEIWITSGSTSGNNIEISSDSDGIKLI